MGTSTARLRELREAVGWSQAEVADALSRLRGDSRAPVTRSDLSRWERGVRVPRAETVRLIADVFGVSAVSLGVGANSATTPTPGMHVEAASAVGMDRRNVLSLLGPAAFAEAMIVGDRVRCQLDNFIGATHVGGLIEEWRWTTVEYARRAAAGGSDEFLFQLFRDVDDLRGVLDGLLAQHDRTELTRIISQLCAVAAVTLIGMDCSFEARRWWRTAERAAAKTATIDAPADLAGYRAVLSLYGTHDVSESLTRAAAVLASGVTGGLAAARASGAQAQALARQREPAAARRALDLHRRHVAALPDMARGPASAFSYSPHALRHTESYVDTWAGRTATAYDTQEAILAEYPTWNERGRAQILLHRSICIMRDGSVSEGVRYALETIEALPVSVRADRFILDVAEAGLETLSPATRRHPVVLDHRRYLNNVRAPLPAS